MSESASVVGVFVWVVACPASRLLSTHMFPFALVPLPEPRVDRFLQIQHKYDHLDAIDFVRSRYTSINLHRAFIEGLRQWEVRRVFSFHVIHVSSPPQTVVPTTTCIYYVGDPWIARNRLS